MTVATSRPSAPPRCGWQFTLGSLLLLVMVAAGVFGWIAHKLRRHDVIWVQISEANEVRVNGQVVPADRLQSHLLACREQLSAEGIASDQVTLHIAIHDEAACRPLRQVMTASLDVQLAKFQLRLDEHTVESFELWEVYSEGTPDESLIPPIPIRLQADAQGNLACVKLGETRVLFAKLRNEIAKLNGAPRYPLENCGWKVEFRPDDHLQFKHLRAAWEQAAWYVDAAGQRIRMVGQVTPFAPHALHPFLEEIDDIEIDEMPAVEDADLEDFLRQPQANEQSPKSAEPPTDSPRPEER